MRHILYTIYGITYQAVLHERIGPVRLLEIPCFICIKGWPHEVRSEYYLIVPANRYAIENRHADQDDQGNQYQRLIHYRYGGWFVTSKDNAYKLLRETQRHPEHFRRIDGETIFKKTTRSFARAA
jgi:hypothetical protein